MPRLIETNNTTNHYESLKEIKRKYETILREKRTNNATPKATVRRRDALTKPQIQELRRPTQGGGHKNKKRTHKKSRK